MRQTGAMASARARQLWELGVPLADAWRAFANEASRQKLQAIPAALAVMADHASQGGEDRWRVLLGSLNAGVAASVQQGELEQHLKEELLTDVLNEQLVALGYRQSPSIGTAPVLIDAAHFEIGEADWRSSRFEANGLIWNRVRVSHPARSAVARKPSSADFIRKVISDFHNADANFCKRPRKSQIHLILGKIGVEPVSGNGLSASNIEKLIVEICGKRAISKTSK